MKGNPPHILVTDMEMPGMRGNELLQRTHAQYPSIQTFILSGKCSNTEIDDLLQEGERFLSKPLSASHLVKILTAVDVSQSTSGAIDNIFDLSEESVFDPRLSFPNSSATYHRSEKPNPTTVAPFGLQIPIIAERIEFKKAKHTMLNGSFVYTYTSEDLPHTASTHLNSLAHARSNQATERDNPVDDLSAARGILFALLISSLMWAALVFLIL